MTRPKTELIWDRVMELAEDEDTTGRIAYGKARGTGRVTVTLDGQRYSVFLERLEQEPSDE